MRRYPPVPPELGGPPTSTERMVRRAPDEVLRKALRVYDWVGNVGFTGTLACVPLGIWHDWRWFPTALLPLAAWVLAHLVTGTIEAELERRHLDVPDCPDLLEGE